MTWRRHAARLLAPAVVATALLGTPDKAAAPLLEEHAVDHVHFPSYAAPYLACLPAEVPAYALPLNPGRVPSAAEAWGDVVRVIDRRVPEKASLIERQIAVESSYDPVAVSDAGAVGLLQLMPLTADWLGGRVMSQEELSCVLTASGDVPAGEYVADLKRLSRAVTRGDAPYALVARLDERFDAAKNVELGIDYHVRFGLGTRPDGVVFLTYIAGPGNVANNTHLGADSHGYFPKILKTDLDAYLPATRERRSTL